MAGLMLRPVLVKLGPASLLVSASSRAGAKPVRDWDVAPSEPGRRPRGSSKARQFDRHWCQRAAPVFGTRRDGLSPRDLGRTARYLLEHFEARFGASPPALGQGETSAFSRLAIRSFEVPERNHRSGMFDGTSRILSASPSRRPRSARKLRGHGLSRRGTATSAAARATARSVPPPGVIACSPRAVEGAVGSRRKRLAKARAFHGLGRVSSPTVPDCLSGRASCGFRNASDSRGGACPEC